MEHTNDPGSASFDADGPRTDDIRRLAETVQQRGGELYEMSRKWVSEHPMAAVGAAFGVGFVLAGGLVSKATLRIAMMGARLYFRRFVGDLVGKGAQELFGGTDMAGGSETVRA